MNDIYIDDKVKDYIVDLVCCTRDPGAYKMEGLQGLIQLGASPRATIALTLAAKAYAFLRGRGYVTPQDVKSIGMDVLRHRVAGHLRSRSGRKNQRNDHHQNFQRTAGAVMPFYLMIPREILKKIRQIELRTTRLVSETLGRPVS